MTQRLKLSDKDFKAAIVTRLQEVKEKTLQINEKIIIISSKIKYK